MELRKATSKDFNEIVKIYIEEFSKPPYNEPWTISKVVDKLKIFEKYADIYVALIDSQIVGFVVINPNQWCPGEIAFGEEFGVKSEYQRKGIGTFISNEILSIYRKKGYKKFMNITNKRAKSLGLFKKLGFSESKTEILMEKKLR